MKPERGGLTIVRLAVLSLLPFALVSSITATDALVILLMFAWLYDLLLGEGRLLGPRAVTGAVLAFFVLGLVVNLVNAGWEPLDEFVLHHFRKVFLLVLLVDALAKVNRIKTTAHLWILAASLASALSLVAFYSRGRYFGGFLNDAGWMRYRAGGPGGWKGNMFANVLACVLPFALFRFQRALEESRTKLMVLLASLTGLGLILGGILITFTRMVIMSSALLLLVSAGLVLWRSGRVRPGSLGIIVAVVLVLGLLAGGVWYLGTSELGTSRFNDVRQLLRHPERSRLYVLWTSALGQLVREPGWLLFGAGTEQGMNLLEARLDRDVWLLTHRDHAHNNIVQYLLDYGLMGLTGYLLLWGAVLYYLVAAPFPVGREWMRWAGLGLILVFQLNGLTEYNWGRSMSHYNVIFGLGLALSASGSDPNDGTKAESSRPIDPAEPNPG